MMTIASNNITLSNVNDGTILHIAYANSADGTDGFYVGGGGTNLIIQSDLKPGYLDRGAGGINTWGPNFYSDNYIATNGVTVFTFSSPDYVFKGSGNHTLAMYDSDKNYLGWKSITSATQTLSKSNVAYIRFSINFSDEGSTSGNLSDWLSAHRYKLEKGSVATPWSPAPSEAHPVYMGTYTDYTQADSLDPTAYLWSQIKGADGKDGVPGKDGLGIKSTAITYQLSSSGTTTPTGTWLTTVPTLTKGQYLWTRTTLVYTDNTTKDVYSVSYVAKDGNNGTDGVAGKDGVGIKSTTITYQSGTSGTVQPTGTWVDNPPSVTDGNYLWTRTVWNYTDGTSETGYSVAKAGEKGDKGADGPQGIPGKPGADGKTSYTHIAYADTATGGGFSPSSDNKKYIGIYTDFIADDSNDATKYTWSLIKGADGKEGPQGIPGPAGADGKTSYLHIAYSNSADGSGCVTSPDINSSYNYIGTYTDYTSTSSTDPSSYKWVAMFDSTKKRNFTAQPTTPYAKGDTWIDRGSATYFCTNSRDSGAFDAGDWKMQQLTIQSLDSNIQTDLNNSVKTTGNYKGVTLNDNGLTATAGDTKVAMNSNDGFLINGASGQEFHVDTAGNLTMQGNITAGNISGVEFTGRDLTLNNSLNVINGQILFANGNGVLSSNGISLKGGGLSISDENGNQTTYVDQHGTFTTNSGVFTGIVHAKQLDLTGDDPSIDVGGGTFHVNSKGQVTANSFTSNNVKITGGVLDAGGVNITNINADNITTGMLSGQHLEINGDTKISGVLNVPEVKLQGKSGMIGLDGSKGILISSADTLFQTRVTRYGLDFLTTTNGRKEIMGGITTGANSNNANLNGISVVLDTGQKLGDPYGGDFFSIGSTTSIKDNDDRTWNAAMDYDASGAIHGGGFMWYEKSYLTGEAQNIYVGGPRGSQYAANDPLFLGTLQFNKSVQPDMRQPVITLGYANTSACSNAGLGILWNQMKPYGNWDITDVSDIWYDGQHFRFTWVSHPSMMGNMRVPSFVKVDPNGGISSGICFAPGSVWSIGATGSGNITRNLL